MQTHCIVQSFQNLPLMCQTNPHLSIARSQDRNNGWIHSKIPFQSRNNTHDSEED